MLLLLNKQNKLLLQHKQLLLTKLPLLLLKLKKAVFTKKSKLSLLKVLHLS